MALLDALETALQTSPHGARAPAGATPPAESSAAKTDAAPGPPVAEIVAAHLQSLQASSPAEADPRAEPDQPEAAQSLAKRNPAVFVGAGTILAVTVLFLGMTLIVGRGRRDPQPTDGTPTALPVGGLLSGATKQAGQSPEATEAPAPAGALSLYYDQNSLYLHNRSGSAFPIAPLAFERLDASGATLNRFGGGHWAEFYNEIDDGWCMRIEIVDRAEWMRPAECGNRYRSTRTPNGDSEWIFWTPQEGSREFRVLWNGEEIGRCALDAGKCGVTLPEDAQAGASGA
jgi:hypothetical protein